MELPFYQVDAFARRRFKGNPAAVVVLEEWLPDDLLQAIAAENNLAETAFVIPGDRHSDLRWFTPTVEVDLCGHATLATAYVLFEHGYVDPPHASFRYQGGHLSVEQDGDLLALDFPARPAERIEFDPAVEAALGARPEALYEARDVMAVFDSEATVRDLTPDFAAVAALDWFAVIATAPGDECDFVSRFFAPAGGIDEDPVTGSAHCTLVPYWAEQLGKNRFEARQVSARGGELHCEDRGARVRIAGRAIEYLRGEISV